MNASEQVLIEKIKRLPPQRFMEVEEFIDFLYTHEDDRHLTQSAAKTGEVSFAPVWSNDEDAVYDRI
ncbi:DUF2281 domain-containing protein [Gammaproteobacteria bacterium]